MSACLSRLGTLVAPLEALERGPRDPRLWPWPAWIGLSVTAVSGSLLYGGSLGLIRAGWSPGGAMLVALSAGSSWLVLGPLLAAFTARRLETVAHASLWTMAVGEAVLVTMALGNLIGAQAASPAGIELANLAGLVVANLLMAAALAWQLCQVGVPVWRTLVVWFVVLDGAGLAVFLLFRGWWPL